MSNQHNFSCIYLVVRWSSDLLATILTFMLIPVGGGVSWWQCELWHPSLYLQDHSQHRSEAGGRDKFHCVVYHLWTTRRQWGQESRNSGKGGYSNSLTDSKHTYSSIHLLGNNLYSYIFQAFPTGSVRKFIYRTDQYLSSIYKLRLWHDSQGKEQVDWYLSSVDIEDFASGIK